MSTVRLKVVLTGDENVGKSSLVRRFVDDQFPENYIPTLGFQIFIKSSTIGDHTVDFQIWDVAGQPSFEFARRNYYTHCHGFLLVLDLTSSKHHLEDWIAEVRAICPGVPFVLVGNKSDLSHHKTTQAEFDNLSRRLGASASVMTSAKTGAGVQEAFDILARAILTSLELNSKLLVSQAKKLT